MPRHDGRDVLDESARPVESARDLDWRLHELRGMPVSSLPDPGRDDASGREAASR